MVDLVSKCATAVFQGCVCLWALTMWEVLDLLLYVVTCIKWIHRFQMSQGIIVLRIHIEELGRKSCV